MTGFEFRYRLSGRAPTIESFAVEGTPLAAGDVVSVAGGRARLASTGDSDLLGVAQETVDGAAEKHVVRVIVDADAVYSVHDPVARRKGASVDLSRTAGAHAIGPTVNADFLIDVDSRAGEETLVWIRGSNRDDPNVVEQARLTGGELNAAIARAVVRYHSQLLGRGPTKAHAFYRDNIVVIVLEDVMNQAEQTLVAAGQEEAVLQTKLAAQVAMRPYLRSMIERLTGCKMLAFMSSNSLDPDVAAEVFLLDRPVS
jgi:uncharacterized protein YbcI